MTCFIHISIILSEILKFSYDDGEALLLMAECLSKLDRLDEAFKPLKNISTTSNNLHLRKEADLMIQVNNFFFPYI